MVLILAVGVGVGAFLLLGVLKTVLGKIPCAHFDFHLYVHVCHCGIADRACGVDFVALGFDSGGVTTGPITAALHHGGGCGHFRYLGRTTNSTENSFGLVALCSVGPIVTVLLLGLQVRAICPIPCQTTAVAPNFIVAFLEEMWKVVKDVLLSLGLIVAFFTVLQITCLKLPKIKIVRMVIGIVYTFVGIVRF